jgi:shikimate kinase
MSQIQSKFQKIFLFGPRGSGKSTIGRLLVNQIKWNFLEMDEKIKNFTGKTIEELTNNGKNWQEFRRLETGLIQNLRDIQKTVISCGGGVGVNIVFNQKYKKTFGQIQKEIINSYPKTLKILLLSSERILALRLNGMFRKQEVTHRPFLNSRSQIFVQNINPNLSSKDLNEVLIREKVRDSLQSYRQRKKKYLNLTENIIFTDTKSQKQIVKEIIQLL